MNAQASAATTAANQQVTITQELEVLRPEIAKVLPSHITPEKFMRVVATAIVQNPTFQKPQLRRSLFTACVKCATDGLVPDGREAALVLFGDAVTYMPMVAGILKKVRNSGELLSLSPNVVHERDTFRFWIDDAGEHILFEPNLKEDRGALMAVFVIAKTKDGGIYTEVMTRQQVEQVREVSRAKNNGPWVSWPSEMWRKTAIRRLAKRLPMSTDLESVIHRDDELYDLKRSTTTTAQSGTAAAKALIGLPILPDADDAAAAIEGDGGERVDTTTGEVQEKDAENGVTIQHAEEPPREKGTPLPGFDEKKAVRLLRSAKTRAALDNAQTGIVTLLHGAETPVAVAAAFEEMKAKFDAEDARQ